MYCDHLIFIGNNLISRKSKETNIVARPNEMEYRVESLSGSTSCSKRFMEVTQMHSCDNQAPCMMPQI